MRFPTSRGLSVPIHHRRLAPALRSFSIAIALGSLAASAFAAQEERYTYFRTVEGTAQLTSNDGSNAEAEANYPILVGDRLWLGDDGRADILLADGSQLSVDGGSELVFEDLAFSADGPAKGNVLRLIRGRIVLDSHGAWANDERETPVVDTQNARVYLQSDGAYLISAVDDGFTEVTVRAGFAEVVDQRGSSIARAGEAVEIVGSDQPRSEVLAARTEIELEAWARKEEARHGGGSDPSLAEPLESTATLAEHGEWLDVENRRAWRPYEPGTSWRPYYNGRWAYTPRGLYWVSADPWSPVTYHYGAWEHDLYYGWLWYPAGIWSPAHVYWYWGPSYAGWMPIGYYANHYAGYYPGYGLRWGLYGWAGGYWDPFYNWNFCHTQYLWGHHPHRYYGYGRDFAHHGNLERGILTTDTGGLGRDQFGRSDLVHVALEKGWRQHVPGEGDLPNVNRFVEGNGGELPEDVARQVLLKPNPTGRSFDDRVAAVLPRSGRGSGTELAENNGAAPGASRQSMQPNPSAQANDGGRAASQVDRRTLSRQGGGPNAAEPSGGTSSARAAGSRQTVARDGSTPSGRSVGAAEPGASSQGSSSGSGRAVISRERSSGDPPATGATRTPVPRADGASSGAERQPVGAPRDPARRVLDGIRGRSRTVPGASASGAAPSGASAAAPQRPTVSRSPVPPSTSGASRQTVGRQPAGGSPSSPSARSAVPTRRPVVVTSPSGGSTSSRGSVSRAPISRPSTPSPSASGTSGASQRQVSRPTTPSPSASGSPGASQRQVVRTPSRPSVSQPSGSSSPSYRSTPRPTSPSRATTSRVTTPTYRSAPRATTPTSRPTTPTVRSTPRAGTSPSRAVSPSYGSRPSVSSSPARSSSPGASASRPTYSRPSTPSSSASTSRATVSRPSSSSGNSGSVARAPSSTSSRSTGAGRAGGSASSSRGAASSSRGGGRPSGRPG